MQQTLTDNNYGVCKYDREIYYTQHDFEVYMGKYKPGNSGHLLKISPSGIRPSVDISYVACTIF